MWLFFLFLSVPLIEIALFIQVGGWIGLWPTLGIVVATAVAGTMLGRSQGSQALQRLRRSFDELRDPTETLAHGAMILFSGALLLTPGLLHRCRGLRASGARCPQFSAQTDQGTGRTAYRVGGQPHWRPSGPVDSDVIEGRLRGSGPAQRPMAVGLDTALRPDSACC
jgi:UPF0716 protein FxsA